MLIYFSLQFFYFCISVHTLTPINNGNSQSEPSIDINTILKMKTIMESMNQKNDPRANLLYSLKLSINSLFKSLTIYTNDFFALK